jgi:molybdopterin/thiamine biosynthesis adenylyltransferase
MVCRLTRNEVERYERQIMIRGLEEEGQKKLKRAKIFIAGAGGLGSPIAIYLAAAGAGKIRIVDQDTVELSNLNRQILHWDENVGTKKVESAALKLKKLNPDVEVEAIADELTKANARQLVSDFDLIIDALDNLPTRYLLNDIALNKNIPLFHGAVYGFEGRVMTVIPGKTACLWCVYHGVVPPDEKVPVIGVTPGVIGCIEATEVIKYILGLGELLTNRLLTFDGLSMRFTEFKVTKDPNCKHCSHLVRKE